MSKIYEKTLRELVSSLRRGDYSLSDVKKDYAARRSVDDVLKSAVEYVDLNTEDSAHLGLPLGVKDNICTKALHTTACSRLLKGYQSPFESTVTQRLYNEGFSLWSKTNMDEFGMGSTTANSCYYKTLNPYNLPNIPQDALCSISHQCDDEKNTNKEYDFYKKARSPGGSSGGSAVAVAAGLVAAALGTDTGGSVRQPAAFCGVVGIKPTYGLCSRWGLMALSSSFDQPGILAKCVWDAAYMLSIMAGSDGRDPTCVGSSQAYHEHLEKPLEGLRVGIPKEWVDSIAHECVRKKMQEVVGILRKRGCQVVDILIDVKESIMPVYHVLMAAEAYSNLARFDTMRYGYRNHHPEKNVDEFFAKNRGFGFGKEVEHRILRGAYVLGKDHYRSHYHKARCMRTLMHDHMKEHFKNVDAIVMPTTDITAPLLEGCDRDLKSLYDHDAWTALANLATLPSISVPCGRDKEGLPIGMQVLCGRFQEKTMFSLAQALENDYGVSPIVNIDHANKK